MAPEEIIARLKALKVSHEKIAIAINRERPAATKLLGGTRTMKAHEVEPLMALLLDHELGVQPQPVRAYESVDILPTFAGAGGGGTGDGEIEKALLPSVLIRDMLRGKSGDFVLINLRGDSMEPDFRHGDQLLIDRRDVNPIQPGPFALLGEGAYVVKNVERHGDALRIFSSNPKYSDERLDADQVHILGRPVWLGRLL